MKNSEFLIGKNLRFVCIGTTVLKIILIPIALLMASLLSNVATNATSGDVPTVISNSLIALAVMIVVVIIRTGAETTIQKKTSVANNKCRTDFFGMLLRNPLNKLFSADQGEINENLNDDISAYAKRYTELIPSVVAAFLAVLIYTIFLSLQSPLIAFTLLAVSMIQLLPPIIVKKYMQISYDECRDMEAQITDHVIEAVHGFEIIKIYGLKLWWQERLADLHKKYLRVGNKSEAVFAAQKAMFQATDNILRFGTYSLLGIYAMLGYCDLDLVVEAVYLSGELFAGIKTLFQTIPQFGVASNANKRLKMWEAPQDVKESESQSFNSIAVHNLHYETSGVEILHDTSCHLDASENYLITGRNGTGKTTFFNLLVGLILPSGGQIRFGEHDDLLREAAYSKELLYIPQNDPEFDFSALTLFKMFDDSVRNQICAYADVFGLQENILSSSIIDLSGGERKKVFLSMAFGISPHWLLLDEPTNSLDEDGKRTLYDLIKKRRGVIIISHDPALKRVIGHTLTWEGGCIV